MNFLIGTFSIQPHCSQNPLEIHCINTSRLMLVCLESLQGIVIHHWHCDKQPFKLITQVTSVPAIVLRYKTTDVPIWKTNVVSWRLFQVDDLTTEKQDLAPSKWGGSRVDCLISSSSNPTLPPTSNDSRKAHLFLNLKALLVLWCIVKTACHCSKGKL